MRASGRGPDGHGRGEPVPVVALFDNGGGPDVEHVGRTDCGERVDVDVCRVSANGDDRVLAGISVQARLDVVLSADPVSLHSSEEE